MLRKRFFKLRLKQGKNRKLKKDAAIMRRIETAGFFKNAKAFFTYIGFRGEVSTEDLIKKYLGKKRIIAPKILDKTEKTISLFEIFAAKYIKGKFGVPEPVYVAPFSGKLDLIFTPGLAFDLRGNRIGYGGGYFDRFLVKTNAIKVGLAYESQIIDKVPSRKYDVAVDYIVTERKIYVCNRIARPGGL